MPKSSEIVIIGAGVIGCSIAYEMAKKGYGVTVIEKGQPGSEASWAAAGMLAPLVEAAHHVPQALTTLFEASHDMYPSFVHDLVEETGIAIGYQQNGSLLVATDYQEAAVLAGLLERLVKADEAVEDLTAKQLHARQPGLAATVQSALFFANDHHINNRDLMHALLAACSERGVEFQTGVPVLEFETEGKRVTAVRTREGSVGGDVIINTAGAWAGVLDKSLPVRPIRGQIVCLQTGKQPFRHLIHSPDCYLVPWPDGRVLVGATMENVGFEKKVTAAGVHSLLSAALKIAPILQGAAIQDMWAGLRPDTSDNLPILGRGEFENYIVAAGHFRNGILLAPITAKLIAELVLTGKSAEALAPFRPDRFL